MASNGNEGQTPRRRELTAQIAAPLRRYVATETGSAGLLLGAALLAVLWANSPFSDSYFSFWGTEISVRIGDWQITETFREWIDEALMAVFFFVIGLEVRRELQMGELTRKSRVVLSVLAGFGGMLIPAIIYLLINGDDPDAAHGWGIVIATDTAFLLGALALVGPRLSTQLRIFLLTVAIVDDIVAIAVIGLFYSGTLEPVALAVAAAGLVVIAVMSAMDVRPSLAYFIVGFGVWVATLISGLHPTLAGMMVGLLVVAHPPRRADVEEAAARAHAYRQSPLPGMALQARRQVDKSISPNERFQAALHPVTSYFIVPLFALANAGVDLRGGVLADALSSPVAIGIVVGLVGGKLVGISLGTLVPRRLGWGELPRGVGSGQVVGGAALSGIGFTVSLLIANLAFDSEELARQATVAILFSALVSVLVSWVIFRLAAVFRGEVSASLPTRLDPEVDPERDHLRGPVDAPLTLVEYGDFECPFCGRSTGMVQELRERFGDQFRYVFRHLALIDVHPHAEMAAEAAEAAGAQGKFWEMHDLLYDHQGDLEIDDLIDYAEAIGLDVDRFSRDLEEGRVSEKVREDVASAEASGVTGTPTFFIGNRRHTGPYDAETLARKLLESAGRSEGGASGPEPEPATA